MTKKQKNLIIFGSFILLAFIFFYQSFLNGLTIQGIDFSLGNEVYFLNQINESPARINSFSWLGFGQGVFNLGYNYLAKLICAENIIQTLTFLLSISTAMIFTFLLLRKLKAEILPSIFGAVAYGFTPHFLTLIYSGHVAVLDMMYFPPIIFYFIIVAFDKKEQNKLLRTLALIIPGIAMGLMVSNAPQRGLYFSVLTAFFILYKLFTENEMSFKTLGADLKTKEVWKDFGRVGIILIFVILSFASGAKTWLGSENVSGSAVGVSEDSEDAKWEFATSWSLHPAEVIDNLAFGYHGTVSGDTEKPYWGDKLFAGNSESIGYFVLMLAIFAAFVGWRKDKNIRFFLIAGLVVLMLSFGKYLPGKVLFKLWYYLPLMDKFRAPSKFVSVFAFCFSVLAGLGLNSLLQMAKERAEKDKRKLDIAWKAGLGFLAIGVVWMIIVIASGDSIADKMAIAYPNKAVKAMIFSLLRMNLFTLTLTLAFYLATVIDKKILNYAIVLPLLLFNIADLWSIDWYFLNKTYIDADEFYQEDGVVSYLAADDEVSRTAMSLKFYYEGQLIPYSTTGLNSTYMTYVFPYYGIESLDVTAVSRMADDYDSFFSSVLYGSQINTDLVDVQNLYNSLMGVSADYTDLINLNLRLMRLANVKYLITDGFLNSANIIYYSIVSNDNFTYVDAQAGVNPYIPTQVTTQYIFEVNDYLPRVGFFANYIVEQDNDMALALISNPNHDIQTFAVINTTNGEPDKLDNYDLKVQAQDITEYSPKRVVINADVTTAGVLVLANRFESAWKATVDGEPVEIFPANYINQGIFIESGEHEVIFEYAPDLLYYWITLITCFIGILAVILFAVFSSLEAKTE